MEIVDSQVHLPMAVSVESMVSSMRAAGVSAALMANQSAVGPDNRRELDAVQTHPDHFALVGGVDMSRADLDGQVKALKSQSGMIGIRIVVCLPEQVKLWNGGAYLQVLAAAQKYGLPVCIYAPCRESEIAAAARALPDLQFVIVHLNAVHGPAAEILGLPSRGPEVFNQLPDLLKLARLPNVALKATALPALSIEPFPYLDLWPYLSKVISAFQPERVMWGTDWTQHAERFTYAEGVAFLRDTSELSAGDKELIMGKSLRRIFRWEKPAH